MSSKKTISLTTFIVFIVYSIVMFVVPTEKDYNFWFVYVFTVISIMFAGGAFFLNLTRKSAERNAKNSAFVYVGWEYFITQTAIGFYELFHPVYSGTSLMVNTILLGVNIIILSILSTEKKEIDRVEKKINEKVFFIKNLQEEIETLKQNMDQQSIRNEFDDLSEVVRYSDPMSHSKLYEIENKIEIEMSKIKEQINQGNFSTISDEIEEIKKLVDERNRKAKMYKGTPENQEREDKPVSNRAVIISVATAVVVLVVGIISYYSIIIPNSKYNEAEKLLNEQKFIEAKVRFDEISGYKDSKDKVNQTIYEYANNLFCNGKYSEAEIEYRKISNYMDSSTRADESVYTYATKLLSEKDYSRSAEQFFRILNYKDSRAKVMEIYNLFGDNDVVYFGQYMGKPIEWQILDTREDKVLLITKDTIDEKAFNTEYKSIEWEDSSLRKWLNEDFYNNFDDGEKEKIIKFEDNDDFITLLSNKNVNRYTKMKKASKPWWLKSTGDESTKAMVVNTNGTVDKKGDLVTKLNGVRPSIWLSIE